MSTPLAPSMSPDTQFFWDGLREHRLLIQRCTSCGTLRHPPRPMCPACNELGWDTVEASGRGTVHSLVMPQHPQFPFLDYPYAVALVELEEGTRLVSNIVGAGPDEVDVGLPVQVEVTRFDEELTLPQFRPVKGG